MDINVCTTDFEYELFIFTSNYTVYVMCIDQHKITISAYCSKFLYLVVYLYLDYNVVATDFQILISIMCVNTMLACVTQEANKYILYIYS